MKYTDSTRGKFNFSLINKVKAQQENIVIQRINYNLWKIVNKSIHSKVMNICVKSKATAGTTTAGAAINRFLTFPIRRRQNNKVC